MTFLHADSGNSAGGLCAVTNAGNFDPKLGGHLILWNFKLVIEFPPGSTILLPSASVTHGNTPIQPGESRYSFTQYCAGGLFRWVEYGLQSVKACSSRDPALKKTMDELAGLRWERALGMFSKVDEVHKDRIEAFNL